MKKLIVALFFLVCIIGCGGGSSNNANLSGYWRGVFTESYIASGEIEAYITQNGNYFEGTFNTAYGPRYISGAISGNGDISGQMIIPSKTGGTIPGTIKGGVEGNNFSCIFSYTTSAMQLVMGSANLTKQ